MVVPQDGARPNLCATSVFICEMLLRRSMSCLDPPPQKEWWRVDSTRLLCRLLWLPGINTVDDKKRPLSGADDAVYTITFPTILPGKYFSSLTPYATSDNMLMANPYSNRSDINFKVGGKASSTAPCL